MLFIVPTGSRFAPFGSTGRGSRSWHSPGLPAFEREPSRSAAKSSESKLGTVQGTIEGIVSPARRSALSNRLPRFDPGGSFGPICLRQKRNKGSICKPLKLNNLNLVEAAGVEDKFGL